jgi:hypothetical protein
VYVALPPNPTGPETRSEVAVVSGLTVRPTGGLLVELAAPEPAPGVKAAVSCGVDTANVAGHQIAAPELTGLFAHPLMGVGPL